MNLSLGIWSGGGGGGWMSGGGGTCGLVLGI